MSWNLKKVSGTLLQLLLQLLPRLLSFFVSLWRSKPMKPIQKWSLIDGTLHLDFPEYEARIALDSDNYFVAVRGTLPLLEWLSAIYRFLSVYRKMVS